MKICSKLFLGLLVVMMMPSATWAYHTFYTNSNQECYVDTSPDDPWDDFFWFCGNQSAKCKGNNYNKDDGKRMMYNGDSFTWPGKESGVKVGDWSDSSAQTYWCCGGTSSGSGKFVQGSSWITKTESVKETLPEGTCTWQRKTNICGKIDNPGSKCTVATGDCAAGYVSHGGKCVKACGEGQAFASSTSATCVSCETNETQGIVNNVCKKCEANEFFSKTKLKCVKYSDMTPISTLAHDECWLCATPGAMYHCLAQVSASGNITNPKLQKACSVEAGEVDASEFVIPDNYASAQTLLSPIFPVKKLYVSTAAVQAHSTLQ